jgi:hypothetical protein
MRITYVVVLLLSSALLVAQEESSLADAAKKARSDNKPKSKVVVTEETLKTERGPFPDIEFDGQQNDKVILTAIRAYRTTHTAEETEHALKDWFFYYDNMQLRLIKENNEISARKQEPAFYNPERYPSNYQQAAREARHDAESEMLDRRVSQKNGMIAGRIQMTLYAIRTELVKQGMKYDWMKVHYGNGIQTYD